MERSMSMSLCGYRTIVESQSKCKRKKEHLIAKEKMCDW